MLTMRPPPPDGRCGSTACVVKTRPRTLVSKARAKTSGVVSRSVPTISAPALLTRMSMVGPKAAVVAATILAGELRSQVSAWILMARTAAPPADEGEPAEERSAMEEMTSSASFSLLGET